MLTWRYGHQVLSFVTFFGIVHLIGRFFAVNGQPTGLDQDLAFGFETVSCRRADARGHHVLGAWEKHRHEAAHHQVIQLLLRIRQARRGLQGRNDRKVIADLGIVKNTLRGLDIAVVERREGMRCQMLHAAVGQHVEGVLGHRQIIFGQCTRIGTRVGKGLVALVQRLRQRQGGFGREAEFTVGFALQRGQVKQLGAGLRGGLGLFCDAGFGAFNGLQNGLRLCCSPHTIGLFFCVLGIFFPCGVEPLTWVGARGGIELRMHFPIIAADELANLLFAHHHHCQGGRLYAADRG